jgi:uncharacterized protein with HEPN domain
MARAPDERLQDLRTAIDRIKRAVAGLDQTSFERMDQEAFVPICWSFVIIGEAIKTLPRELLDRHPTVDWKGFARFRDVLAHQYFRIDPTLLWNATSVSLPPLDAAVAAEMAGAATPPRDFDA